MPGPKPTEAKRNAVDDLRGASQLAVDATKGVTAVVEAAQVNIASGPTILGRPFEGLARLFTGPVYEGIQGVTRLVGAAIDLALRRVAPLLGDTVPARQVEAVLSVLNGVVGDYLQASGNPLAIEMQLRHQDHPLALEPKALRAACPQVGGKLLVLVHGICANERIWNRLGHDTGAALEKDLGFTSVYLHYNSGLHISTNGRDMAALLERLVAAWPTPVDELVIVGHSMGGLVARSACHAGEAGGHRWRKRLGRLVCLGSPHLGAPIERGGHWVEVLLGASRYAAPFAQLGRIRGAGVTDLRFGSLRDEDWKGRDRFAATGNRPSPLPLPDGVKCYAIAATLAAKAGENLPGDGLVPVDSALGRDPKPELTLGFPEANQWIGYGMGHLDLLSRPEVYATLRAWLAG